MRGKSGVKRSKGPGGMGDTGSGMYRKNQEIELEITDLGTEGEGIGRTDAFLWFIRNTVPGDRVRATVMKVKKNYGYARLQKVLRPSENRISPPCSVALTCGGCTLQMMNYEAQLRIKEQTLRNNLLRIGGLDLTHVSVHPIIGMEFPFRYRNKAQLPVGSDGDGLPVAGFYAGGSHRIIPCADCLIGVKENGPLRDAVLSWMKRNQILPYQETTGEGFVRHILIRKGFCSGEMMVCLVTNAEEARHGALQELAEVLMQFPAVTTVVQNINTERSNVILGKRTKILAGPGVIHDRIGEVEFALSAQSFYQVNPIQTRKLYETALHYANLSGTELVWDLYCGIGTISLFLAKKAKAVRGVEIVPQAIADAKRNAARNGIDNAVFFVGKAEEILPREYGRTGEQADVIVVDPPRKGCDERCLRTMRKMEPKRIVYVSCDSATLARDLKYLLADGGYVLTDVQPVDMFPQTGHVETIVLLSKLDSKNHISVELPMDDMDLTSAESKATYEQIQNYVLEKYDFKVSTLYIAQVKRKYGLEVRKHYNISKNGNQKVPQCPIEKEEAILAALKHFKMV